MTAHTIGETFAVWHNYGDARIDRCQDRSAGSANRGKPPRFFVGDTNDGDRPPAARSSRKRGRNDSEHHRGHNHD